MPSKTLFLISAIASLVVLSPDLAALSAQAASVTLPIPARLQWANYAGYCGETSLQMAALYYGAYISQFQARAAGGGTQKTGQLLLPDSPTASVTGGASIVKAAANLKLNLVSFPTADASQGKQVELWIKNQLWAQRPVISTVYVADCDPCDTEYDHIVPFFGYSGANSSVWTGTDTLSAYTLFSKTAVTRSFNAFLGDAVESGSNSACNKDTLSGGCISVNAGYAIAITGIKDANSASVRIKLAIDRADEPNVSQGAAPVSLTGTVTVSGLVKGKKYRLLRYDSIAKVPVSGGPSVFASAAADTKLDFIAPGTSWTYVDPRKIISNGVAYYRCVPM